MKFQKLCILLQKIFIFTVLLFSCLSQANPSPQAVSCKNVISNLTKFAQAVTQNADFANSKEHTRLFQLYRTQFLGKEDTARTLKDIMYIVEEYPELSKPALREQILTLEQRNYEPPQSLREVVQRLKNSAHQFQAQVFQPEANIGFWQRLLMPLKKEELNGLSKQEKKAKQKEHKAQFREYFDQVLTPEDLEILKNDSINNIEKTVSVYRILDRIRIQMIEEGRNVQALSQAMVDLVHTSGFRNPHYISMLKSQNALDQIRGLEQILNERDIVAIRLNFENYFSELINSLNVDHPTGSTKKENLSQILSDIQREIQNNPYTVLGQQVLRVRALSLQESPFRGCLGGDCSTKTYFDLGLDSNFIYFTLTNEEFQSSGHITVVLGKARSEKEQSRIKIAFVDKIQNVPQVMILPMLEAVRLSLEELGYRLGLPVDIGDHNGLSNSETIRAYMDSEVNPLFTHQLTTFKPHKNKYNFDEGYSKAYSKPNLLEFERWEAHDFKVEAGEIYIRSKIPEELKVEDLYQEILSLKDSNKEEDQIQFINHLKLLTEVEELDLSEDFAVDYLNSKIKDKKVSFKVRKKSLYTLISFGEVKKQDILDWITNHFSENEQTVFVGEISNWIDSNEEYKQDFVDDFLHEFLKEHIEKNVSFSFQSVIFNILNNNIEVKESVLFRAVGRGDQAMAQFILDRGADIHAESYREEEVLFAAVRKGDQAMAQFLLDRGADIHARNIYRETVLFPPVEERGDQAMVQFLLDRGADIHARKRGGETVLFAAVRKGDQAMAQFLLDRGADIHARNIYRETVLFPPVEERGDQAMVQFLLDRGADIHARKRGGETVLFAAVRKGDRSMVQFLLDRGKFSWMRLLWTCVIDLWCNFF